ncbi:MAG: MBL fold metallo-hydrolase [Bacteroidota bacterium]|nr:MBL fold metallo-hydrolase [Bacteroidota bacterium]
MNRTLKRILIGLAIVIFFLSLVIGGLYLKMRSEMKKMNVIETKEVVHNIYAIKDSFVNMFVVKDSDRYVAIDAGDDLNAIAVELKRLNVSPVKVTAVLLTHTDGDHVAAIKLFKKATVYLSKDEEQMINGKTSRMMSSHNKIDTKVYTLLDDQQVIRIGNVRIKAIMTPGHTPGSMSYLVNDKYLFVGDAFSLKAGKIDKPNKLFTGDMKTAIQSFKKITNLPGAEFIFTGHTGYTNDYKKAIKTELK